MPTNLFILIFVAGPVDYARYRPAALYFEFESYAHDETGTMVGVETPTHLKSLLMEVVGSNGTYAFSERRNSDSALGSSSELLAVISTFLLCFVVGACQ